MAQNNYIEVKQKRFGRPLNYDEKKRKRLAREHHEVSRKSHHLTGIKAKIFNKKRYTDKVKIREQIRIHDNKHTSLKMLDSLQKGAIPSYLLDRENVHKGKVLTNMIKEMRKEKAGKWNLPISKVKAFTQDEMFQIRRSGKRKRKVWKKVVKKICFVGNDFVRKPPKYERFIRPSGLRFKKAHVTHPHLKTTFYLDIVSVKANYQSELYTSLGVITKGTIIEVNVNELGLVTQSGKVIWAKYAQVTNNPEFDGCINAVLLV